MLTGALLLPKRYDLKDFLRKRFSRIILPFLFWSCVYILFALSAKLTQTPTMTALGIGIYIFDLFRMGASVHLWYIYMVIGLYLFIPILSKWVQNCNDKELLYFLIIWVIAILLNQPFLEKFNTEIDLSYFSDFIGYLVLGYYLSIKKFNFSHKTIQIGSFLLFIAGVVITVLGTYFLTYKEGKFNEYFYDYLAPNTVITSIGIFVLFKNWNFTNPIALKIIDFIGKYSYGIYLVHVLILQFLSKLGIDYSFMNPIFSIPLTSLTCLFFSSLIIYFLNKLPFCSKISG
jgi:surface polysaccharide O-acyltransferase-like enzyme